MDITLRLFVLLVSVSVFFLVIFKLLKHQLSESNSILWIAIGFMTLIAGVFPDIVDWLAFSVGIAYPPTLLFLLAMIVFMLILFQNSMYISRMQEKVDEIATTLSIIKEENRKLKSNSYNRRFTQRRRKDGATFHPIYENRRRQDRRESEVVTDPRIRINVERDE